MKEKKFFFISNRFSIQSHFHNVANTTHTNAQYTMYIYFIIIIIINQQSKKNSLLHLF